MRASGASLTVKYAWVLINRNYYALLLRNWRRSSRSRRAMPRNESENQLLADDSLHGFSDIWLRLSRSTTPGHLFSPCGTHVAGIVHRLCSHPNYRDAPRVLDIAHPACSFDRASTITHPPSPCAQGYRYFIGRRCDRPADFYGLSTSLEGRLSCW